MQIIRRFEIEIVKEGRYVVAGGVAYNKDFTVKLLSTGMIRMKNNMPIRELAFGYLS